MNESNNFEEDDQLEQKANSESIVVVTTYPRYFNNRETGFGSQIAERNNNNQVSTGFNQSVLEQNIDTHSPQSFSPIGTGRVGYGTDYLNNKAMPKTQQERVQSQNFAGNLLTYRGYNSSTGENISEYRKTFKNSLNNQSHNSTVDVVVTDDSLIDNEDKLIDLDRTQERTLERQVESNIFDNQLDGTPRSSMDSKTPRPNNIALQLAREIAQQNQTESLGLASNQVRKILDPKRAKMVKKFLKIKREQDQYLFTGPNVTLFMFSQMCSVAFFFLPVDGPRLLAPFIILVFIFMGISYAQTYLYLSMRQDHPFALFTQDVAFGEGYGRASIVYISLIQLFQYIFNPFFLLYRAY